MEKSTSWLKKGLLGLATIATLGFGTQKVEAQEIGPNDYHTLGLLLSDAQAVQREKEAAKYIDYSKFTSPKVTDGNEALKKMHINYFHRKDNTEFNKYAHEVLRQSNNKPPLFYFITLNQAFNREGNDIGQELVDSYQTIKNNAQKNNKPLFFALKSMEYFYGTFGVEQNKQKYENFLDLTLSHLADYTHLKEISGINSEEKFRAYINNDNRTAEELVNLYKTSYGSASKLKADQNFDIIWYAMGAKTLQELKDARKDNNNTKFKTMLNTTKTNYFMDLKKKYNIYEKLIYDEKARNADVETYIAFNPLNKR